jgi:hypothetical protein
MNDFVYATDQDVQMYERIQYMNMHRFMQRNTSRLEFL